MPTPEEVNKMLNETSQESVAPVPSVTQLPVVAAPDSKKVKKPLSYEKRLRKMSNKQLAGEIRRKMDDKRVPRINEITAIVLNEVFESHLSGVAPYLR